MSSCIFRCWNKYWNSGKKKFARLEDVQMEFSKKKSLQIRKLYEPEKYESALIHPVFLEYFHRNLNELSSSLPYICAIGFEPNPNHEQMLKSKISNTYKN